MGKAGRPPGPLRGRTEQANALAQFLRELTAESTVRDLERRYSLARSSWSEYRSGQKIIPWDRLSKVVEHRFAHDPRARQLAMDNARRLHAAAVSAQPRSAAPAPVPADPADPADTSAHRAAPTEAGDAGQPADNPPTSTDTPSAPGAAPDPGSSAAALPSSVPPGPQGVGACEPAEPPAPRSVGTDLVAAASLPAGGPPAPAPATARKRTGAERSAGIGSWWSRWRTPVQWALLGVLLAVVVLANQAQRPGGQPAAAPSAPSTADSVGGQPADVPPDSPATGSTPEQPASSPAPEPPAPAASTPATLPPAPAGAPAAPGTAPSRPAATPTQPAATPPPPAPAPVPAAPAPSPAAPDGPPRRSLRNVATGLCVDVPTSGVPNMGHPVVQERCGASGEHLQYFDLVPAAGGASGFALRPAGSTLCVDPPEHGAPTNAQVGLYPCDLTAADNHLWRLQWNDTNGFMLVNVKSDGTATPMCLDVPGHADPTPGLRLGVYPCHPDPGDDQWWAFT
ncbi:ricin-type beta-trefoil lectin domain protein [Kitasatospora sp. NPDC127111]|uniref:RICIN domain-containing protein n=1 Tax=Kitasatospora sp. NPDC127111 TaxID=3345363 RepID=UPI0036270EB8